MARDELPKREEEAGGLAFMSVTNDGETHSGRWLVQLKCIFSAQVCLPRPRARPRSRVCLLKG